MIYIFSYQREQMLKSVVRCLQDKDYLILDDGSDFELPRMIKFPHEGKFGFWKKWAYALDHAKSTKDELFVFMPSDFLQLDLARLESLHLSHRHEPYVYNLIDDGRNKCWNNIPAKPYNQQTIQVGFTDCGFFCNRTALEALEFKMFPISRISFYLRSSTSSGVGRQLTKRLNRLQVKIFKPIKSLALHGDHPSLMHAKERLRNPLLSQ